ncbi:MAG: hypothetical protein JF607_28620 [Burkholderiales bacterium]|jgi:hypothetical protein|nr:hypothetical protein [Burkholderiales bacterium]
MATSSQGDPRKAILDHLTQQVQLTDGARQLLQGLLADIDLNQVQGPADLSRALQSMDNLAAHLSVRRGLGPVDAQTLQMSLRDLCPLFPIC